MVWYYVKDGARQGPVEEAEFNQLIQQEVVRPNTLVWSEGMAEWKPYSAVAPAPESAAAPEPAAAITATSEAIASPTAVATAATEPEQTAQVAAPVQATPTLYCSQCGQPYPSEELVRFGPATVCANCKDIYAQRLRETGQVAGTRVYAGFWIRFVAVLIDTLALTIVNFAIQSVTATRIRPGDINNLALVMSSIGLSFAISMTIQLLYEAFFLVRFGATPGKMVFGLKVITPEGGGISWGRAIGRFFAKILSGITLSIGYIMAGFDPEKRALHDYIAGTRVIRTT
jgi:uncharacterized RDD family membrane protein YckC